MNTTLPQGVTGVETDTGFLKVGDGVTPWSQLPYAISEPGSPSDGVPPSTWQATGTLYRVTATDLPLPDGAATNAAVEASTAVLGDISEKLDALSLAGGLPVALPASQLTALTPPAQITGFALETTLGQVLARLNAPLNVAGSFWPASQAVTGTVALDEASLDAIAGAAGGGAGSSAGLTNAELRATPVPVAGVVSLDAASLAALETINIGNLPVTQQITAQALPLPAGAATEVTLAAVAAKLPTAPALDRVTAAAPTSMRLSDGAGFYDARQTRALTAADVVSISGPVGVTGTFWPTTQPVSFAWAGLTNSDLRAEPVPVSAAALPLPSGASSEVTVAALLVAANAIKAAAEALNGKAAVINTGAIGGTVALDSATLAALENITAATGGLTNSELRAAPVQMAAAALPLPNGAASDLALASVLAKLSNDPATQTTLAALLARSPALATRVPFDHDAAVPVRQAPVRMTRCSFSDVGSGLLAVDMTLLQTGAGQTVSQSAGNAVFVSGTTANAETLARSVETFNGALQLRFKSTLSQRIAQNTFSVELADLVGEALGFTINSATSVTVAFVGANPFSASNVGQAVNLSLITGAAGIPGRFVIASVSGLTVNFTVAGWPATGSGTLTLWGWNYFRVLYDGTTATSAKFDSQRKGWASGDTTISINSTAAPGHVGHVQTNASLFAVSDGLVASNAAYQLTPRGSRIENLPDDEQPLYLWLRCQNGTTAPASTTTWTVGFWSVEETGRNKVYVSGADQNGASFALPAQVVNTVTADTELPAAAALADSAANPTTPIAGAAQQLFNGASWDRSRNNHIVTMGDTGAKAATFNGATQTNFNARGALITLVVSAVTGSGASCTVQLQVSYDGTNFDNLGPATAALVAAGRVSLLVYPANSSQAAGATPAALTSGATVFQAINAPLPRGWRLVYTITGTGPSFTFTNAFAAYIL